MVCGSLSGTLPIPPKHTSRLAGMSSCTSAENFMFRSPPRTIRASAMRPPLCPSTLDAAVAIRLYRRDVVRNGERYVKRARVVSATTRLTHVGRRPELDAVPAQADNAELADGLVADLRTKLTQSLVSRRDFARIGIDEIHTGERELIAPLSHNMTGASGGLEMARVGIRLGGRMADGRDALDFKPIITI